MPTSLPKDYKKLVQSLIHRHDISLNVKIDLWKRFAEYEACVDEERRADDEEAPVFTATKASVGEIGPDVEMPVPWMESDSSEDGDSGYGGNGSNSVDGVEHAEGEESTDAAVQAEGEKNVDAEGHSAEEEITAIIGAGSGQGKSDEDDSNGNGNGNRSPNGTAFNPEATSTCITTTTTTAIINQETDATQHPNPFAHPTTHATPPTPTPAPRPASNIFAQVRLDIQSYFADLAKRERLLAAREAWVTSRAKALWRNAEVLAGMLKREERAMREFEGEEMGRKRVMREFEEGRGRKRSRRL